MKQDAYWDNETRLIPFAVQKLLELSAPGIQDILGPSVVLVPAPGSAPFRQRDALWVPRRICQELVGRGLGARWEPWLERVYAVRKSAFAGPGERPTAQGHYESMRVARRVTDEKDPAAITLVDDVLTKGATLRAGASLLAEAFPGAKVRAFALIRTAAGAADFRQIVDPTFGEILAGRDGSTYHLP